MKKSDCKVCDDRNKTLRCIPYRSNGTTHLQLSIADETIAYCDDDWKLLACGRRSTLLMSRVNTQMGWEKRKSNSYFYQHRRLPDGRKSKVYFGNGFDAHVAANLLTLRNAARHVEAEALRRIRAETQEADELLKSYSKQVSEFITTEMFEAGFHNPRSRGWRRIMKTESSVATESTKTSTATAGKTPRRSKGDTSAREKTSKPATSQSPQEQHSSRSTSNGHAARMSREAQQLNQQLHEKFMRESAANQTDQPGDAGKTNNASEPSKSVEEMSFEELKAAAEGGNATVMKRLRAMMRKDVRHYRELGNAGAVALTKWGDVLCRKDLYQLECLQMHNAALRAKHLEEGNSPIERLLVAEVLLCWQRQSYWAQNEPSAIQNCPNPKVLKFSIEQTQKSQRMYLKALGKLQDYRNAKARLPSLANQDETEAA